MIIVVLTVLGLCLGSFANAVVWRIHEQSGKKKPNAKLSISRGRSMCIHCGHELAAKDLVPVVSWLSLRGKCRYCKKPIPVQYPVVELVTAALFIFSYMYWPHTLPMAISKDWLLFSFWLVFLTGFMILAVYDLRWYLLPDRVLRPLAVLAVLQASILIILFDGGLGAVKSAIWGILIGGGLFYGLFQISNGKWIGGGDVKLGALLGLIVGGPGSAVLLLFVASLLGTVVSVPLLISGKASRTSRLPFGPFLLASAIIVYLFGAGFIAWYRRQFLLY